MKTYTRKDIEDFINSLPEEQRKRAWQMQWKIDHTLDRCKDDTQRFNKMVELFWEGFLKFQNVMLNPLSERSLKKDSNNVVCFKKD